MSKKKPKSPTPHAKDGKFAEKPIDPAQVRALAGIACPDEEIATILHTSADTLTRRFRKELDEGRDNLRMSLRRMQTKLAMEGDKTMLIWLGKNLLGQKDRSEVVTQDKTEQRVAGMSREQYRQRQLDRVRQLLANGNAATGECLELLDPKAEQPG